MSLTDQEAADLRAEAKAAYENGICKRYDVSVNPATVLRLLDDRKQLIDEIARLRADAEWLPISTAPRDSRAILVWTPKYENTFCVVWNDNHKAWRHFGTGDGLCEKPTHWRPLPMPPEARS